MCNDFAEEFLVRIARLVNPDGEVNETIQASAMRIVLPEDGQENEDAMYSADSFRVFPDAGLLEVNDVSGGCEVYYFPEVPNELLAQYAQIEEELKNKYNIKKEIYLNDGNHEYMVRQIKHRKSHLSKMHLRDEKMPRPEGEPPEYISNAYKHSKAHRLEIERSDTCGCFYCFYIFYKIKSPFVKGFSSSSSFFLINPGFFLNQAGFPRFVSGTLPIYPQSFQTWEPPGFSFWEQMTAADGEPSVLQPS